MNISSSPLISPLLPTFYHKFPLSDRKNENPPLFLCLINHGLNKFHKKRTRHNTWQALFIGSNTKVSVPDLLHDRLVFLLQMINDDKPIIRKKGGVFYVYGTPWMGKSNIGANISAPLGAVFLLERDRVNYAEKVSAGKVFPKLLEATLISKKQDRMSKILELYDEIFSAVDLYSLHCTISDDAVTAAYDAICK